MELYEEISKLYNLLRREAGLALLDDDPASYKYATKLFAAAATVHDIGLDLFPEVHDEV